jgi:DNA polymerase-3 subunit gamma/tau
LSYSIGLKSFNFCFCRGTKKKTDTKLEQAQVIESKEAKEPEQSSSVNKETPYIKPAEIALPAPPVVEEIIPPSPIPTEKPKVSIQSLKAVPSIIPNLNDLSGSNNKVEEDEPKYVSGESRKPFSADEFLNLWNNYAADIKKAGKINLFTIMTANPPTVLDEFKIELTIENRIQEELLMVEKIDLLNFLRVKLENFGIDIITRQAEQNQKKKLYTSHEKYQHMVNKNPKLEEFRRKFNLDVN